MNTDWYSPPPTGGPLPPGFTFEQRFIPLKITRLTYAAEQKIRADHPAPDYDEDLIVNRFFEGTVMYDTELQTVSWPSMGAVAILWDLADRYSVDSTHIRSEDWLLFEKTVAAGHFIPRTIE